MLRKLLLVIIPITSVFLQSGIRQIQIFMDNPPSLILLSLMYFTSQQGLVSSFAMGLILGLLIDFLSITPLGFFGLTYLIIGFILGLIKNRVYMEKILPLIAIIVSFYFLRELLIIILSAIFQYSYTLSLNILLSLLITVVFAIILYVINQIVQKLHPSTTRREESNAKK